MENEESLDFAVLEENEKKLIEILGHMENYQPLIPEELIDHYFTKAGVQCDDVRLKRLVSVIGQKFLSDVTSDALKYSKLRTGAPNTAMRSSAQRGKQMFSLEDLTFALGERGIQVKRPPYHQ